MERGLQECREGVANVQLPVKGQISESACQEHARGTEQAVENLRSQLTAHEKKYHEGERQMRRLQEEVKTMNQSQPSDARIEAPSELHLDVSSRLLRLEEELRKQQKQYERTREDDFEDTKVVKSYVREAHEMVTALHRRQESSSSTQA